MPITMYDASVPVLKHTLKALSAILDKADAHCAARKIEPAVMLGMRLFPDMFPLSRQIQIACDFAKGAGARLAGIEVPGYPDDEKTFGELKARISKTIAFLDTIKAEQIVGSEERDVKMKAGPRELEFKGQEYLTGFVLPNFYFHVTTAYSILRTNGVEVGKFDFLGVPRPA
jgi:uncharacterized protein